MNSKICELLDIEFPLVAFTHCRDVVVAVSKAGGCGVLGAVGMSPEQLEQELKWIDDHIDGKPYGVDVLIPNNFVLYIATSYVTDTLRKVLRWRNPKQDRKILGL